MKLSNRQLLNSIDPLNQLNSLKLPVKTAFRLAKLSRAVDEAIKDYRKTLEGLHDEFAEKDPETGEKVVVESTVQFADREGFDKAFEELLECETELSMKKIPLNALSSVEVEPSLLYHLDWLLQE